LVPAAAARAAVESSSVRLFRFIAGLLPCAPGSAQNADGSTLVETFREPRKIAARLGSKRTGKQAFA
jgi:hypothetical protein